MLHPHLALAVEVEAASSSADGISEQISMLVPGMLSLLTSGSVRLPHNNNLEQDAALH
jgi:hypothetical protein